MRALGQDTLFPSNPPRNTSACVNRGQLTRPRQLLARGSFFTGHIWPARTPALRWPRRGWGGSDVPAKFKTRITSTIRNLAPGNGAKLHWQLNTCARWKEVCWPRVTRSPLPFSAACVISVCVVPNPTTLKLLQVQINSYRFIEPPLNSLWNERPIIGQTMAIT